MGPFDETDSIPLTEYFPFVCGPYRLNSNVPTKVAKVSQEFSQPSNDRRTEELSEILRLPKLACLVDQFWRLNTDRIGCGVSKGMAGFSITGDHRFLGKKEFRLGNVDSY
jgi:hypothetical protein